MEEFQVSSHEWRIITEKHLMRRPLIITFSIVLLCLYQQMSKSLSIKSFFRPNGQQASKTTVTEVISSSPNKRQKTASGAGALSSSSSSSSSLSSTGAGTADESSVVQSSKVTWGPFEAMNPTWKLVLSPELQKPYFKSLLQFLATESKTKTVFPPSDDVFSAFNLCPYDQVKVVVIGQDPYHGAGQAHGLAFSVQKGVQIPPSLRNMIKEAVEDPKVGISHPPTHGNLECWAKQGVLMLNTVLTVRKNEANSHQKKGWENFTDAVVKGLAKKEGIVYLLWGKPAQTKCNGIDRKKNTVIQCSHPSPLAAYKTNEPFITSKCFSRCNDALVSMQKEPIDWNIR